MRYKFLVVDDTRFMRMMLTNILKENDYDVVGEADNGQTAIDLYRKLKPDVTMMDITMSGMNGIEAMKEIRKINPQAVVLICSAMSQQDLIGTALDAGADGYVVKPFKPDKVQDVIQEFAVPKLLENGRYAEESLEVELTEERPEPELIEVELTEVELTEPELTDESPESELIEFELTEVDETEEDVEEDAADRDRIAEEEGWVSVQIPASSLFSDVNAHSGSDLSATAYRLIEGKLMEGLTADPPAEDDPEDAETLKLLITEEEQRLLLAQTVDEIPLTEAVLEAAVAGIASTGPLMGSFLPQTAPEPARVTEAVLEAAVAGIASTGPLMGSFLPQTVPEPPRVTEAELVAAAADIAAIEPQPAPFLPQTAPEPSEQVSVPPMTPAATEAPVRSQPAFDLTPNSPDHGVPLALGVLNSLHLCNWREERGGELTLYSAQITESENKFLLEMVNGENEKSTVEMSLSGFRQLSRWIDKITGESG